MWFPLPDCRVASPCLGQLHYYCTSGDSKDGPPKQGPVNVPSTEKVLSGKTLLFYYYSIFSIVYSILQYIISIFLIIRSYKQCIYLTFNSDMQIRH